MMMIRLLPNQIGQYWEIIKYTIANVDDYHRDYLEKYLNKILHDLLSDKAQCFFRLDPDSRDILTVFITQIEINTISEERFFAIKTIYSFRPANNETWESNVNFLMEFARKNECTTIVYRSRQERAWDIGKYIGFKEDYRAFYHKL